MRVFWKSAGRSLSRHPTPRARPFLEELETRLVPYSASGNAWPAPQLVTLSFMPDGTLLASGSNGNSYNDLNARFNARWSTDTWKAEILKAAQAWAAAANINFTVVSDNGTTAGQGSYQQGDPGMGDIRFGSYSYTTSYVGQAFMPPPVNNFSIAGDIDFNSAKTYNINGAAYDLQTVAVHEVGHALGLDHSTTTAAAMWPAYGGLKRSLNADDIAGIQAIYGARAPDAYAGNSSFATATALTSPLNPLTQTAQLNNLNITSTGDTHYFAFTTPLVGSGLLGSGSMTVSVQSSGLSLLRPSVTVYAADQTTVVGSSTGCGYYGSTLNVTVNGINPLETYYIKVTGADTTSFGTGSYALSVAVNTSLPTVTPPNTQLANGTVLSGGGGIPQEVGDAEADGYAADDTVPDTGFHGPLAGLPTTGRGADAQAGQQVLPGVLASDLSRFVAFSLDVQPNPGSAGPSGNGNTASERVHDPQAVEALQPKGLFDSGGHAFSGDTGPFHAASFRANSAHHASDALFSDPEWMGDFFRMDDSAYQPGREEAAPRAAPDGASSAHPPQQQESQDNGDAPVAPDAPRE